MGVGCSFFWISGDTFPNRKQNCSFVIQKNYLYATTSSTSSSRINWWRMPLSSLWEIHCRVYTLISFLRLFLAFTMQKAQAESGKCSLATNRVEQLPSMFTHSWPIIRARFHKFAILYFAVRQVGYAHGNMRNNGFQLPRQQCCKTSWGIMLPILPNLYSCHCSQLN